MWHHAHHSTMYTVWLPCKGNSFVHNIAPATTDIYICVLLHWKHITTTKKKVQNIQILSVDVIYMYMYLMEPIHVHMANLNVYSSSLCHHQHFSLSSLQERKDKPQPRSRQEPPAIWLVKLGSVVTFVSLQASRCSELILPKFSIMLDKTRCRSLTLD